MQYWSTLTGRITTFNFLETTASSHLASQRYILCYNQIIWMMPCVPRILAFIDNDIERHIFNLYTQSCVHIFSYSACIRRQAGYCCIQYQACSGVPGSFSLDATPTTGLADTKCSMDYIGIPGNIASSAYSKNETSRNKKLHAAL